MIINYFGINLLRGFLKLLTIFRNYQNLQTAFLFITLCLAIYADPTQHGMTLIYISSPSLIGPHSF